MVQMNSFAKQKQSHRCRQKPYSYQSGWGEVGDWGWHVYTTMYRRRQWHPTPVLLPGESQGRWSLMDCCLWGRTKLDTTEAT